MTSISTYFRVNQISSTVVQSAKVLHSEPIIGYGTISTTSTIERLFNTLSVSNEKSSYVKANVGSEVIGSGQLNLAEDIREYSSNLTHTPSTLTVSGFLSVKRSGGLSDGPNLDSPQFMIDITGSNSINIYDKFFSKIQYGVLRVDPSASVSCYGTIPTFLATTISGSDSIQIRDETSFAIVDKVPAPNDVLVNPDTYVEFRLLDEATGIDETSLSITIDGVNIVIDGETQTGGWSLDKTIQEIGPPPNSIIYRYTPASPFEEGKDIAVSIFGQDNASPSANVTNETYSFRPWVKLGFPGTITIDPDIDFPYLANIVPASGSTNTLTCNNISFDVLDDTTGINLSNLIVLVNSIVICSGTYASSNTIVTPIEHGYTIEHNIEPLAFGTQYDIQVFAEDNYSLDRHRLNTSYSFSTVDNDSITIENFFIADVEASTTITTDTLISVDILDPVYGIDLTGSKIYVNGEEVVFDSEVITNGYRLTHSPSILLNQVDFVFITVHAQNLRDLGCPVYKEREFKLSFGYKVTVLPEKYYKYNEDVYQLITANTLNRNIDTLNEFYLFTTHPVSKADFGATIDTRRRTSDLGGVISPVAPRFYYNKLIPIRVEAKDLNGNEMEPFEFTFRIEKKPQ
jgi:hypothetical protein